MVVEYPQTLVTFFRAKLLGMICDLYQGAKVKIAKIKTILRIIEIYPKILINGGIELIASNNVSTPQPALQHYQCSQH